jgi:acyl-CoA synthetase (AMP-forming)/AMP-acid ligase II
VEIIGNSIISTLEQALAKCPDKIALVDGDKKFTYNEFAFRVSLLARFLRAGGEGNVVAFLGPNCHQFMECYYAAAAAGHIFNPLNFRLAAPELANILAHSGVKILFAHSDFSALVAEVVNRTPNLSLVVFFGEGKRLPLGCPSADYEKSLAGGTGNEANEVFESLRADQPILINDPAHLYYTSGTTGMAKGVVLTHANVLHHALSAIEELQLSDADRWLHVAPMFHLADAWATFAITACGGTHVFLPYFSSKSVLKCLSQEKITITNMVPTMLSALINDPDLANYHYDSLRVMLSGGAPIAPETVRRIIAGFGCDYVQTYGMTETSPYLTLSLLKDHMLTWPEEKKLQVKCRTGRPFARVDLKVVRADGTSVEANDLEVGEIIVRGPTVTPGYWHNLEATKEAIVGGWLHTGDLAVIDQEGYVNIVDRKKDVVLTGGETVYSTEVEYVLYEHPAVAECAVVGMPDPTWGEIVTAYVVVREGHSLKADELIEFVKGRLAHYKSPKEVYFLNELPKTGSGKIYKKGLREAAAQFSKEALS